MYKRTILDNGVRVITEEIPFVRSVSIGLWVKVGSRGETKSTNGVSHFIEHLLFKGTGKRTARRIAEEIDGIGGQLNAFTSKECTCYYAKVLDNHFPVAVEILADMFLRSLFDPAEIEKERGVVIEEIKMCEDSPDELVHDLFAQTLWNSHPLGLPTVGAADVINDLPRDEILQYVANHYTADNLIVCAVGNVGHDQVVREVSKHFENLGRREREASGPRPAPHFNTKMRHKDIEQVHLCLGTVGYTRNHPNKFALYVLDGIIGGGMSSRLFQELREERGLVYSTYSYHAAYQDAGLFAVYAAMSPANVEKVVELMLKDFEAVANRGVSAGELVRGKEQLKGNMVLNLEGTSSRMSRLAKLELFYDRLYTPEEVMAAIDVVTLEDVQRVACEILGGRKLCLAVVGPSDEKNSDIGSLIE